MNKNQLNDEIVKQMKLWSYTMRTEYNSSVFLMFLRDLCVDSPVMRAFVLTPP